MPRVNFIWYIHSAFHIVSDSVNEGTPTYNEQWMMLPFDGWDCD